MDKINYGAIIEARMGSSRLPGKSFMDLCGEPLIKRVVDRIKCSKKIETIVLATTTNDKDDILEDFSQEENISCYRGSEDNVLERVLFAAKQFSIKNIIELHGDNPFLDGSLIDNVIKKYETYKCDYISNTLKKTFPMGLRVQVFKTSELEKIYKTVNDPAVEEHVSNYFYENPNLYNIVNYEADSETTRPEIRLIVDTNEDLAFAKNIYKFILQGLIIQILKLKIF